MDTTQDILKNQLTSYKKTIETLKKELDFEKDRNDKNWEYILLLESNLEKNNYTNKLSKNYNHYLEKNYFEENDDSKHVLQSLKEDKTKCQYFLLKSKPSLKLLSFLPYFYIIKKSLFSNLILNIRFYRAVKNSGWFNIGFYLKNNPDVYRSDFIKYLDPIVHYIYNGFEENRYPNIFFKESLTDENKRRIIAEIKD